MKRIYYSLKILYASWYSAFNQSRSSGLPGQISDHAPLILAEELLHQIHSLANPPSSLVPSSASSI